MAEQKVQCSECFKTLTGNINFCCHSLKSFCYDCLEVTCRLCFKIMKEPIKAQNIVNRAKCFGCGDPENKYRSIYFFENNCKQYYCPPCLIAFYQNYQEMIINFQKQYGNTLQMQVELKCGCQIEKNIMADYLRKYCLICGKRNQGNKCIELADKCRVMIECYEKMEKDAKYKLFTKGKSKRLYEYIQKNILRCQHCNSFIDGERHKLGEQINGIIICMKCLIIAKEAEVKYSQKSERKEKEKQEEMKKKLFQQSCQWCLTKNTEKVNGQSVCKTCYEIVSKDVAKVEQKEEEKIISKLKKSRFNALECKLCFNGESSMMNKACRHLMMCEQCFQAYSNKHGGNNRLPCPLCNTVGDYFFYVAPIYS